jgi:aminocarboxymuconate-semialdehyde decarboxylase
VTVQIARREFLAALAAAAGTLMTGCAGSPTAGSRPRVIDAHSHWYPQEFIDIVLREGAAHGGKLGRDASGSATFTLPGMNSVFAPIYTDLESRIRMMDDAGINAQVLSLMQPMVYWAPPELGLQLSQAYNDACSAAHRKYPERFFGLAMAPLQSPELALRELERAGKLPGLRGLMMATAVNGRNLDDKALFPVYAKCEELGWPIFPHPIAPLGGERMRSYNMSNLLGNPVEIGVAAAALIYGGVLETYPKLEVMLPRAGGNLPFGIGRFDRNAETTPALKNMKQPPSAYLRRFYCDTIIENAQVLTALVRLMGADRVVFGTDYASANRDKRPVEFIEGLSELSPQERELILGGTAAKLFKI